MMKYINIIIFKEWKKKLIALLIAFSIYIWVGKINHVESPYNCRININKTKIPRKYFTDFQFESLPRVGLIVSGEKKPLNNLNIETEKICYLDLSDASPEKLYYQVKIDNKYKPDPSLDYRITEPKTIKIVFQRIIQKQAEVDFLTNFDPVSKVIVEEGYSISDVVFSPKIVKISGPENEVNKIEKLYIDFNESKKELLSLKLTNAKKSKVKLTIPKEFPHVVLINNREELAKELWINYEFNVVYDPTSSLQPLAPIQSSASISKSDVQQIDNSNSAVDKTDVNKQNKKQNESDEYDQPHSDKKNSDKKETDKKEITNTSSDKKDNINELKPEQPESSKSKVDEDIVEKAFDYIPIVVQNNDPEPKLRIEEESSLVVRVLVRGPSKYVQRITNIEAFINIDRYTLPKVYSLPVQYIINPRDEEYMISENVTVKVYPSKVQVSLSLIDY